MTAGEIGRGVMDARRVGQIGRFRDVLRRRDRHLEELRDRHRSYSTTISAPDHAISLPTAALLASLLDVYQPRRVLDLGSGFSSFVARAYGDMNSEVVSVDDDPRWLDRTRSYVREQGVERGHIVDVSWLNQAHSPFDLVFNDFAHMQARCYWLPAVARLIAPDGLGLLDDFQKYRYRRTVRAYAAVEGAGVLSVREWTHDDIGRYAALWIPGFSSLWTQWE
jgi:predicted O-methyltransferase YrrM